MRIKWHKNMQRAEWNALLGRCPHTSLLQSYPYAQTMREVHSQGVRHGVISMNGRDVGIVQMQEVSLFNQLIHILSIDRGPLWFDGVDCTPEMMLEFTRLLDKEFPRRFGRKRRFMPEFSHDNDIKFENNWHLNPKIKQYKTYIVDIDPKLDEIRENLKKKWRNILNKFEKSDLKCVFDEKLEGLSGFLQSYMQDRLQKRYAGASAKFLASLCKYTTINQDCFLLHAMVGRHVVATILVVKHGRGATYQAGWTSDQGRRLGAHHFLLWQAITLLKGRGVTHFDLGGYNDENEGLQKFKAGLNGQDIALIGSYS